MTRAERWLFIGLVALQLVPFWVVRRVPTTDGPSHVYNAWIELHLHDPRYPQIGRAFELDRRPLPNWTAQAALAALLTVLPPTVAEKVFLSGAVLLLLVAVRGWIGSVAPQRTWLAVLGVPFALNWTLHFGFYSFCVGIAFYLLALGCWWRRRERPDGRLAVELTLLLLLTYFSHILVLVLALFSLGLLWLALLPRAVRAGRTGRHAIHLAILAPQAILPLGFVLTHRGPAPEALADLPRRLGDLLALRALFTYGEPLLGVLLATTFLVLASWTLLGRRERREGRWRRPVGEEGALLLLAVALAGVALLAPDAMSGGSLIAFRLTLFPFLVLLAWLAPPPLPGLRGAVLAIGAVLSLWNVADVGRAYRVLDREVEAKLAATGPIAPGTTVLPLYLDFGTRSVVGPFLFTHVVDRVAVEKGLVLLSNYEAASGLFPIRFRDSVLRPSLAQIERSPGSLELEQFAPVTDYVYVWRMSPRSAFARRLETGYAPVREVGEVRLFERFDRLPVAGPAPARVSPPGRS